MQKTYEIFPAGTEIVDVVKEKEALYASLMASRGQEITSAHYISMLSSALRCGLIDDTIYDSQIELLTLQTVPFIVLTSNLSKKLIDDLEKDFAAMEAGEANDACAKGTPRVSDQDENLIAECVREEVVKVEE
jgi:hypothetical protein